jgi:hypothetical protein
VSRSVAHFVVGSALVLALLGGCSPVAPTSRPSSWPATTEPSGTPTPTLGTPTSTPAPTAGVDAIRIRDLPSAPLPDRGLAAICDHYPDQVSSEAGETNISCREGIHAGLRAALLVTASPVEKAYLDRPDCATVPCFEIALNTATLYLWTADGPIQTFMDGRDWTMTRPTPAASPPWPASSSIDAPTFAAPQFEGAPIEVRRREPLPYCGRSRPNDDPRLGPLQCFLDAVLEGRPAEVLEVVWPIDFGDIGTRITRTEPDGRIVEYLRHGGEWRRTVGALVLCPDAAWCWSLEWWDSRRLR